jgi:hypothetical protein
MLVRCVVGHFSSKIGLVELLSPPLGYLRDGLIFCPVPGNLLLLFLSLSGPLSMLLFRLFCLLAQLGAAPTVRLALVADPLLVLVPRVVTCKQARATSMAARNATLPFPLLLILLSAPQHTHLAHTSLAGVVV